MGYNKLNIARTVGPNLGRMIEHLIKQNKELQEEVNDRVVIEDIADAFGSEEGEDFDWESEIHELQEKNKQLQESDKHLNKCIDSIRDQYLEVKEKNKQLEMKSNAKSDIIKNMFECITADPEEVQDGFYIKRDWGHKYIDTWNEIVTQEYKDALKEINEQLEGIEWETDGFQFDLNIVDESESEEEEEEEEDVVFLYPNDAGSIQDPEHPEDNYSFGNNRKSKIGDNSTMKRILKNGSIKDCVVANAYCMFVKGGKLYYQGRSSSGPAHIRTIKGEKTTMEFPY